MSETEINQYLADNGWKRYESAAVRELKLKPLGWNEEEN